MKRNGYTSLINFTRNSARIVGIVDGELQFIGDVSIMRQWLICINRGKPNTDFKGTVVIAEVMVQPHNVTRKTYVIIVRVLLTN